MRCLLGSKASTDDAGFRALSAYCVAKPDVMTVTLTVNRHDDPC